MTQVTEKQLNERNRKTEEARRLSSGRGWTFEQREAFEGWFACRWPENLAEDLLRNFEYNYVNNPNW